MILSIGLNPAVDVTYHVSTLTVGTTNRVNRAHAHAGGKATNVARVLHQLGEPVCLISMAGGRTGDDFRADLQSSGIPAELVPIAGATRRTVAVIDAAAATLLNEPGPTVSRAEWRTFLMTYQMSLSRARVVVLCGSIPPGVPTDAYQELIELAHSAGVMTILDTEGPKLLKALAARPTVVKLNLEELSATMSRDVHDDADLAAAALGLRGLGAQAVVVSRGSDGVVAITDSGIWQAVATTISGNPTGAGDALAAGLAVGLAHGREWEAILIDAVALATAAVAVEVAGAVDVAVLERVRTTVSRRPE
ncbi:MAG: 1-phosphofructokinase family hexose kinase [Actinomycetota bacterium]|nr:1-phosphofructokinase family hexose kinase [Actinomycetota bacterium]